MRRERENECYANYCNFICAAMVYMNYMYCFSLVCVYKTSLIFITLNNKVTLV